MTMPLAPWEQVLHCGICKKDTMHVYFNIGYWRCCACGELKR